MKIGKKIQVYSSLFLTGMLILLTLLVAILYFGLSLQREQDFLEGQADIVKEMAQDGGLWRVSSSSLLAHTPEDGMIRVVDSNGQISAISSEEDDLKEMTPVLAVEDEADWLQLDGDRYLAYRVPIYSEKGQAGTVEAVMSIDHLFESLWLLLLIMSGASLLIIGLSVAAGKGLAKLILKPVSQMSRTMAEIEQSGAHKRIDMEGRSKDELVEMAATFNKMMGKLEQNYKQQQRFLSDASHELKTPLTIIESYASLLLRWGMDDVETRKEAVEVIRHEADRMKHLTAALLDAAAPREEVPAEKIELVEFCGSVAHTLEMSLERLIIVNNTEPVIDVMIQPQKLEQMLIILLDNAVKYSNDDITLSILRDTNSLRITIEDKGIGIPKNEQVQVFDRFYRVDASRTRATGGSGLGLSIAKSLAQSLGAEIELISIEGEGTSISIVLSH